MINLGNVFILGDSYSTYGGWIPPECAVYYADGDRKQTGVTDVSETWWHRLLQQTQSHLLLNHSYSGSTVCNTRFNGEYCPTTSFIGRLDACIRDGYFTDHRVDTMLVFGGTNDSWANSPIGSLQWDSWDAESLKSALPAFCYLLCRLKKHVSSAKTVVILNSLLKPEILDGYCEACEKMGIAYIKLGSFEIHEGHPTAAGMEQICAQILTGISAIK